MFRIKIAMIVGGAVLAFMGYKEFKLSGVAKAEPSAITCADLAANGPGENAHVTVSDFLLSDSMVYEEKKGRWTRVWVPALPIGGEYQKKILALIDENGKLPAQVPPPTNIKIILKFTDCRNEADLDRYADAETIQGIVVNEIDSLGSEERKILEESYPGVNFATCHLLEVGRRAPSAGATYGMLGGGAALAIAGIAMFVVGGKKNE